MILPTNKKERIKIALKKRSVFVFYLAALLTTFILTYPEEDHKNQDPRSAQQQEIKLQPASFEFKEFIKQNEGSIYSI